MKYALTIVVLAIALGASSQGTSLVRERRGDTTDLSPAKGEAQVEPLRLVKTMEIPAVEGKFDHFGVDVKGQRLFLTSTAHKSIEVFDLAAGKWIRSIGGFVTPHAILYIPASNRLLVSDGGDDTPNGWCRIVRGDTFEIIASLKLAVDADPIRYDPATKHLYIANGGKDAGNSYSLISVIDTTNGEHVGDIRVESPELEAMAVERSGKRLFVNIKTHNQIGIIDPEKQQVVSTWPIPDAKVPTPMALDEDHHRLLVACRTPPRLVVFNTETGKEVASVPCGGGADDLFYDGARKRIYITGEEGLISVIGQTDPDHYEAIKTITTGPLARNSLFVPELNQFFVAVPGKGEQKAKVLVFQAEP
jgi:DNA-binding beta-propeller fold protein YncE